MRATTVLNFGFGSPTTALNFRLGSRTTLGFGLVVRLQYSTLGWVVGLQNSSLGLNFGFGSQTTAPNFRLGSRTALRQDSDLSNKGYSLLQEVCINCLLYTSDAADE